MHEEEDVSGEHPSDSKTHPGIISRMGLNDNKAGMEGLDKEKINKIILENSIGSKFFENERKKDAQVNARIQKLVEQMEGITPAQKDAALRQTNEIIQQLEDSRDLSRTIVHIDMDAFYASVEERDRPDLKNKPMAVGGMGMLSTSNYLARRYGVRAAMPGFIGKKLCPELVLVPLNFQKYTEVSHQVREIFSVYDPNFVPMSLDEAYLDITPYLQERKSMPESGRTFVTISDKTLNPTADDMITFGNSAEEVVKEIRFKIQQKTKLTASAGIAPNSLLAKVASDMNKPNGQFYLAPTRENVMDFIRKLPIRKVCGIGKVTEKLLNAIGVQTCQHLYDKRAIFYLLFSEIMSNSFLRITMGIGSTMLENCTERKSLSTERTFREISDPYEMYKKCEELCKSLEEDAKKGNIKGLTVTLKIKTSDFELYTRSKSLPYPVGSKSEIYPVIIDLLKQEITAKKQQLKLRLIGVGLSKLTKSGNEPQQKSMDYFLQKAQGKATTEEVENTRNEEKIDCDANEHSTIEQPFDQNSPGCSMRTNEMNTELESTCKNIPENRCTDNNMPTDTKFQCPVCTTDFNDLSTLNSHIDHCLTIEKDNLRAENDEIQNFAAKSGQPSNNNTLDWNREVSCLTCPLCNAIFCCQDITLDKFNSHVDSCLNRKTIRELIRSTNDQTSNSKNKKNSTMSGPPKKRQKTSKKTCCTLDKFFK